MADCTVEELPLELAILPTEELERMTFRVVEGQVVQAVAIVSTC